MAILIPVLFISQITSHSLNYLKKMCQAARGKKDN